MKLKLASMKPQLIRGLCNIKSHNRGSAVTIGNFDGVHRGHQQLLTKLHDAAAERGLTSTLITFEPHPQEYFNQATPPARLTNLREKLLLTQQTALDYILCLRFDAWLVNLSADEFIKRILVDCLDIKYLLVGDDFRFGHQRAGNFALLTQASEQYGFAIAKQDSVIMQEQRVSSSRIRAALQDGDLQLAQTLLGRPYCICGKVVYGDQRGRTIGYPTANIALNRKAVPLKGVYAVRVFGLEGGTFNGMANVGVRPTVDGARTSLEVNIFDFSQDIYGKYIEIEFIKKLRDEKRFAGLDELKQQLAQDEQDARRALVGNKHE